MRLKKTALLAASALLAATAVTACGSVEEEPKVTSCVKADLKLTTAGKLTIGTDSPAYDPWFSDNDPTNGKGFESATAYAVAKQLGFDKADVTWVKVPFNNSYASGPKKFDFDINQISITPDREKGVDFSDGYYHAAQAVIVLDKDKVQAGSIADLAKLKLGAQTGTTSLTAVREDVKPTQDPVVFKDTNVAKQALLNGQVDAIVADLPTALYISGVEISGSSIVGQFQSSSDEEFGLLTQKGSSLTPCLSKAVDALKGNGTLAGFEKQYIPETVNVPVLK